MKNVKLYYHTDTTTWLVEMSRLSKPCSFTIAPKDPGAFTEVTLFPAPHFFSPDVPSSTCQGCALNDEPPAEGLPDWPRITVHKLCNVTPCGDNLWVIDPTATVFPTMRLLGWKPQ